jgi:hypothetical protein
MTEQEKQSDRVVPSSNLEMVEEEKTREEVTSNSSDKVEKILMRTVC